MSGSRSVIQAQAAAISALADAYDPEDTSSHYALLTAAKVLAESMITPAQHVLQQSINITQVFAIRMLLKLGVLAAFPKRGSHGIAIDELALRTGVQAEMITRFLRLLVGTRFIHRDGSSGEYSHSRFSEAYLQAPGDYFASHHDECFISLFLYGELMDDLPEFRTREPEDGYRQVYSWRHGRLGDSPWDIMQSFPQRMARFQSGLSMLGPMSPVLGFFDFARLAVETDSQQVSFVDIGGGLGQCIAEILSAHPTLRPADMVLHDLPALIEASKHQPNLPPEVMRIPIDFFKESPVKGAKAYYLRNVLHDWPDALCVQILKNIAKAMTMESVLLVADTILPDQVDEETLLAATMDLYMFNIAGKERTVDGFKNILAPAGLRIEKVYTRRGTAQGLLEAVLM